MKKKIGVLLLPLVFITTLLNVSCPSSWGYNIVGSWTLEAIVENEAKSGTLTFVGEKDSGTCTISIEGEFYSGVYSVLKEDVDFSFKFEGVTVIVIEGKFENKDKMSGTGTYDWGSDPGTFTWSAVRKD